jgi:hypothetical protein
MQSVAGINTVMAFSHWHVARQYHPGFAPSTDEEGNELTDVWVETHPKYYANPKLIGENPNAKFADRDVIQEMIEVGKPRGMDVFARILEPYVITGAIPGFERFAEVDVHGEKTNHVCFNHPGYIKYWRSTINDLVRHHQDLAGFKFGQERAGPLLAALGKDTPGHCFCRYCTAIAKRRGLRIDDARQGLIELQKLGNQIRAGEIPSDGRFVAFLRILINHSELLAWERMWMDSREEQRKRIYRQIKAINPNVEVGWHIDHGMTWDLFMRASWDYAQMGPYSDWLSVAVYFDSMGQRSLGHYNRNYRKILFGDSDPSHSYPMYLAMLGYDPKKEPSLATQEKTTTAFSADYVYQECKRAVKAVGGRAKVYGRPGFDMPKYEEANVQPKMVYDVATAALKAGVDGLWCGREWDELQQKNAEAFGNAVRDWVKRT